MTNQPNDPMVLEDQMIGSYLDKSKRQSPVARPKVVAPEKPVAPRHRGCQPRCSCTGCSCLFLLTICGLIALVILIIATRPPLLWEPFKLVLNNATTPQILSTGGIDGASSLSRIEEQLRQGRVTITESELAVIASQQLKRDVGIDLQTGKALVYLNLENQGGNPLWLIIEIGKDQNKQLRVTRIGTGLFALPSFVTDNATAFLSELLAGPLSGAANLNLVKLQDIEIRNDELVIVTDIRLQ